MISRLESIQKFKRKTNPDQTRPNVMKKSHHGNTRSNILIQLLEKMAKKWKTFFSTLLHLLIFIVFIQHFRSAKFKNVLLEKFWIEISEWKFATNLIFVQTNDWLQLCMSSVSILHSNHFNFDCIFFIFHFCTAQLTSKTNKQTNEKTIWILQSCRVRQGKVNGMTFM